MMLLHIPVTANVPAVWGAGELPSASLSAVKM